MNRELLEHHVRAPAAAAFMARAFLPSPGLPGDGGFPRIVQRWSGLRVDANHHAEFSRATGLGSEEGISVLYPHVLGFRLHMALLTHRAYPLPIWNALQIRNRLVRHRRIDVRDTLDLETRTGAHRRLEKGVEVDVGTRLMRGPDLCWESTITYFYRGRNGAGGTRAPEVVAPDPSRVSGTQRFRLPQSGGWRFGSLTGDYNGIHCWDWYARRFGFRKAFAHPQRIAGMCMAALRGPQSDAQTLELWIKGPLFYGAEVALNAVTNDRGVEFGLSLYGERRAALVGRWHGAPE